MQENGAEFSLKLMLRQTALANDKMLDDFKVVFESVKGKIQTLNDTFKSLCTMKEILTEKTYFSFFDKGHHDQI